jgi:predicted nucleotidyltransferase
MMLDGISVSDTAFRSLLDHYSVKQLAIFGSRARGNHRPDSDIDFLVDFLPSARIDLLDFIHLKLDLEALLGLPVDLVERTAVKPRVKDRVYAESRVVYACQ